MERQIVLDTETTGLSPAQGHRIIEIGCVEIIKRQVTGRQFQVYVNPQRAVDEGAFKVHGISEDFLLDKPVFADIVDDFLSFIDGSELVIHNAPFDVGFLEHELASLAQSRGKLMDKATVLDTLTLARSKHPGQGNSLDALCRRYHVDSSERELHGALLDSDLLAQVYLAMTGGQTQLFVKAADTVSSDKQPKASAIVVDRKVISATQEESSAHEQWLQKARTKGACLWPDNSD